MLHDRPPSHFHRTEPMMQHELFTRLTSTLGLPDDLAPTTTSTAFTTAKVNSIPSLREDRPALLVSSTSWTADEDFSLLLTALDRYQSAKNTDLGLPCLVVLITGKGALRAAFQKTVTEREKTIWKDIVVRCVFLPARDYPVLLGCADLGISLHVSSSGRDLPMKVVDMFGCSVPVLAKRFECIGELVKDGKNGRLFDTGEDLGQSIVVSGEPKPQASLISRICSLRSRIQRPWKI